MVAAAATTTTITVAPPLVLAATEEQAVEVETTAMEERLHEEGVHHPSRLQACLLWLLLRVKRQLLPRGVHLLTLITMEHLTQLLTTEQGLPLQLQWQPCKLTQTLTLPTINGPSVLLLETPLKCLQCWARWVIMLDWGLVSACLWRVAMKEVLIGMEVCTMLVVGGGVLVHRQGNIITIMVSIGRSRGVISLLLLLRIMVILSRVIIIMGLLITMEGTTNNSDTNIMDTTIVQDTRGILLLPIPTRIIIQAIIATT
jgi:hypothetical protein